MTAQPALIPGGLTALPPVTLSPNLLTNGGFEAVIGAAPANWGIGGGWTADQLVAHSGSYSYRWTSGAPSSEQQVFLGAGVYNLTGWVKTQGVGTGSAGVRLLLDLRAGGINQWFPTDVIQGTNDWTYYTIQSVVVPQDMLVAVRLENYAGASGTAWFDDVALQQQLPPPINSFMLYPNYRGMLFDDGPLTMRFDLSVTPPAGDFSRVKVTGILSDEATGQRVGSQDYTATASFVAQLDGTVMQSGRAYLATFALVDLSTGATVYTTPAYRVSRVAAAVRQSMTISFDAKNHVLVRGTPRFVLGVYDSGLGYSADASFWETTLWSSTGDRRMGGLRINFYLNYMFGEATADAMTALMTNLQSHGAMYLQTGNCFDKYVTDPAFFINSSDTYLQTIGAQPASAGYYTIDECQSFLVPGAFTQYQRLRSLDADSMTFAALLGDVNTPLWRDSTDVLATDPYPMYGAEPAGGYYHAEVADWTALARNAVKDARPYMTVLQFFQFTSLGRWPTLPEMRSHAYMAIVEGAKGLFWWSLGSGALADVCADWCATRTQYMNNLKTVVNELADLEPVLLADDVPGLLVGNTNTGAIKTKVKMVDNRGYLFAYNYTNQSVTPTFSWSTTPGTVTVNAENRSIVTSGNSFSDTFGPYQAHVYLIDGTSGAQQPVNVALQANGAVATASSVYSAAYPASAVIDGDRKGVNPGAGGYWNDASPTAFPDWIQVTFNGPKTITEIDIFSLQDAYLNPVDPTPSMTFSAYGISDFDVQYWTGTTWVTVPGGSITGNRQVWTRLTFAAITTDRIRVVVNRAVDLWSRIVEIEAWSTATTPPATNVAAQFNGGAAVASTTYSADYPASAVNDGDRRGVNPGAGGYWNDASPTAFPDWTQVTFNGLKTITEIDIFTLQDAYMTPVDPTPGMTFSAYGITDFDVQYWTGGTWATVPGGSVTGNHQIWTRLTFPAITTDRIRVVVNGAADYLWSRIVEIEAWGN